MWNRRRKEGTKDEEEIKNKGEEMHEQKVNITVTNRIGIRRERKEGRSCKIIIVMMRR